MAIAAVGMAGAVRSLPAGVYVQAVQEGDVDKAAWTVFKDGRMSHQCDNYGGCGTGRCRNRWRRFLSKSSAAGAAGAVRDPLTGVYV